MVRAGELGVVGLNFSAKEEVAPFSDAWYVLSVEARTAILIRQARGLQRLLHLLDKKYEIESIPFSLHELINVLTDAAHARIVSLSDVCLIIVRETYEIDLDDVTTTFGNIRRNLNDNTTFPILGRLTDSNRPWKIRRNERFHSGFHHEVDENDLGFEFGSLWRDRGLGIVLNSPQCREVSLQELFDKRKEQLLVEALNELNFQISQIELLLNILQPEFEKRFKEKIERKNSYMHRVRGSIAT